MSSRRSQRISIAAWLGILSLAIQALVPALLAAEIRLAQSEQGQSIFTLCAYGHLHTHAAQQEGDTPSHDDDIGTICPICIALLASPTFTAPPEIALPLPAVAHVESADESPCAFPRATYAAAYHSRAPPSL
jgi:hypothetical protein